MFDHVFTMPTPERPLRADICYGTGTLYGVLIDPVSGLRLPYMQRVPLAPPVRLDPDAHLGAVDA